MSTLGTLGTLGTLEGENEQIPNPTPPKTNTLAVAIGFIGLIIILGGVAFFALKEEPENELPIETTTTNTHNNAQAILDDVDTKARPETKEFDTFEDDQDNNVDKTFPDQPRYESLPPVITIDKSRSSLSTGASASSIMPALSSNGGGVNHDLNAYSQQMQSLLASTALGVTGAPTANSLEESLTGTSTPRATASALPNRNFLLTKGTFIDCVLNTALNSSVAGLTKCTLTRHIYSDNGNTLLLERGSTVTGEYRANLAQGQTRLFVLWDRVKTPHGVVVDLTSPSTDPLGGSGADGYIETHFWKRYGGAMMLSLVDDLAAYATQSGGDTAITLQNSSQAAQNAASEALKNTINIPPTLKKNQGDRIGIFVARDIDFSHVYGLEPTQ